MCCTWLAENIGRKRSPSAHHRTTLSVYIFATKACIENLEKKLVRQQYLLQMSAQYGERRPTNDWGTLASLEHPSKFELVSHLGFDTAATSLTGGQPNFARSLAISWAGTLYVHFLHFWDSCHVQNSLCIQVLHSRILARYSSSGPQARY